MIGENLLLSEFTKNLVRWYDQHGRSLPWVGEKDPYKIWLSEVILQQTRVQQGLDYYYRFITHYPTVLSLAAADEDHVLKLWEGLGYYSRGRNLLKTAKIIVGKYDGRFPEDYSDIIKLPGIGPYTAAAILSFAFEKPYPVIDGNVYRVISRITGDFFPIDHSNSRLHYLEKVTKALGSNKASLFNQAIMDFGAVQCVPKSPQCPDCPMTQICVANKESLVEKLPVKSKTIQKKYRFLNFIWMEDHVGGYWIERRNQGDIWEGLYQPFYLEFDYKIEDYSLIEKGLMKKYELSADRIQLRRVLRHNLTHQILDIQIFTGGFKNNFVPSNPEIIYCEREKLSNYAFPKPLMDNIRKNFYLYF